MSTSASIEDRFNAAALRVCTCAECLDLKERLSHRDNSPNESLQSLRTQIKNEGAAQAVRSRLASNSDPDDFVELWARKRLDLTMEALTIRPAWSSLFSADERAAAASRLIKALASPECGGLAPPHEPSSDLTIRWLDEVLRSSEPTPHDGERFDQDLNSCEAIENIAREFDETGLLDAPFDARRHYLSCSRCSESYPRLGPVITELDEQLFQRWRQSLDLLAKCLAAPESVRFEPVYEEGVGFKISDPFWIEKKTAFAWRAIVCGYGAHVPAPRLWRWGLTNAADAPFHQFAASLTAPDVAGLYFCSDASRLFCDLQLHLFFVDQTHPVLPTHGDLSSVPGVVEAVPSTDFDQWLKLMTGVEETLMEGEDLFQHLHNTAVLKQSLNSITAPSADSDIKTVIQEQIDRISDLRDAVDSNSSARIPIIDPLQREISKMIGTRRYRAEESLRKILTDQVYNSLCEGARIAAIVAEYCWRDADFPDPSNVVTYLATAFERQLREGVLKPFCDELVASGARNYPEPNGFDPRTSRVVRKTGGPPGPGMPPPLPQLLKGGTMNTRLNLGDMRVLLNQPLQPMLRIFGDWGLDAAELARSCGQIAGRRNPASHQGNITREEAEHIRRVWLGINDGGSSIFAAVIPRFNSGSVEGS